MGSPLYAGLLRDLAAEYLSRRSLRQLLSGITDRPVHDALPLRLLGAIHRLTLTGQAPLLANHYPSTGGQPTSSLLDDFLRTIDDNQDHVRQCLYLNVQTNEVGRSVVPLVLLHWLCDQGISECDYYELGASAGLNMLCDRYCARSGDAVFGEPRSPVQFTGSWCTATPAVGSRVVRIVNRRGVDTFPRDVHSDDDMIALESFIWPDQTERLLRFRNAVQLARTNPPAVDTGSADTWLAEHLQSRARATVVFHSIVWQYLGATVQDSLRDTLNDVGANATEDHPLIWARMEPAGSVADVRATIWSNGSRREHVLATVGYHGQNLTWSAT